ncbi:MAG: hypothetical protein RLZZ618_2321 [Pseudomonadota bacterium]|jgi:Zn-dependent protease with chaperone function
MSEDLLRHLKLVALLILLPLALGAAGLWELHRVRMETVGHDDAAAQTEIAELRAAQSRVLNDPSIRVTVSGKSYVSGAAYSVLETRIRELNGSGGMRWGSNATAPKVVAGFSALMVASGFVGMLMGGGGLVLAVVAGRMARRSREQLLKVFSLARHVLPFLLAGVMLLTVLAVIGLTGAEAVRLFASSAEHSRGVMKLAVGGLVLAGLFIFAGLASIFNLRKSFAAFESEPLEQFGRLVTAAEAPGLWRQVRHLAGKLNAPVPDNIVVGLTNGYYVTAHPICLLPQQQVVTGETLYLSLSYTALMRPEEFNAIVGHELGHFSGDDTVYSQRFLPMHSGMQRSLALTWEGGWMVAPARLLGEFLMEQVQHAVSYWSREREFAADGSGKHIAGSRASARALVRYSAVHPVIQDFLDDVFLHPERAPADLLQALVDKARTGGLADPELQAESATFHPTDTHPPTVQRIKALGEVLDASLLAEAAETVDDRGLELLRSFFTDRLAVQHALSADLASEWLKDKQAARAELQSVAAQAHAEPPMDVMEGQMLRIVLFGLIAASLTFFGAWAALAGQKQLLRWVGLGMVAGSVLIWLVVWWCVKRRGRAVMHLAPEGLSGGALAELLPWTAIDDIRMAVANDVNCRIEFILYPQGPTPRLLHSDLWRMTYKKRKRHLVVTMSGIRGMGFQDLLDRLHRYRRAGLAAQVLSSM